MSRLAAIALVFCAGCASDSYDWTGLWVGTVTSHLVADTGETADQGPMAVSWRFEEDEDGLFVAGDCTALFKPTSDTHLRVLPTTCSSSVVRTDVLTGEGTRDGDLLTVTMSFLFRASDGNGHGTSTYLLERSN